MLHYLLTGSGLNCLLMTAQGCKLQRGKVFVLLGTLQRGKVFVFLGTLPKNCPKVSINNPACSLIFADFP